MAFGWSNVARSPNPEQGHGHGIHGSPKRLQPSTFTTVSGMPGTPKDLGENRFVAHDAVTLGLHGVLPICDLIVGSDEEIQMLGGAANSVAALRNIRARTSATVDLKRGERGCVVFSGPVPDELEEGVVAPGFAWRCTTFLAQGTLFMGGYLRGWLRD